MTFILALAYLLTPSAETPPELRNYLQRCEAAKTAAVAEKEALLKSLTGEKLQDASTALAKFKAAPAQFLHLPLPPQKGELGTFAVANELPGGKSVIVLEVIDKENVIVRAWYLPAGEMQPTFVDLWIQGVNTSDFSGNAAAVFPQVFQVTGNKLIDTTCGRRSFPLLQPVEIEKHREKK